MRKWLGRAGWFVLLWLTSVTVLTVVAYAIRLVILPES